MAFHSGIRLTLMTEVWVFNTRGVCTIAHGGTEDIYYSS